MSWACCSIWFTVRCTVSVRVWKSLSKEITVDHAGPDSGAIPWGCDGPGMSVYVGWDGPTISGIGREVKGGAKPGNPVKQ